MSEAPLGRDPVTVAAGDLLLRAWSEADAPAVLAASADPALARWNPLPLQPSPDDPLEPARAFCRARADWSDGLHASWAIVPGAAPADVLGAMSVFHVDADQLDAECGYWLAPAARGHGAAARALDAAATWAFDRGLMRLQLFHAVDNPASCTVATRAGFLYEGTHRRSHRYGDGTWCDEHTHARLADDPPPHPTP